MNPINKILKIAGLRLARLGDTTPIWRNAFEAQSKLSAQGTPCIFDVGANRGKNSEAYLKQFPSCQLHCFEPLPECFNLLVSQFANSSNVKVHPIAMSDRTGSADFFCNALDETSSLLPFSSAAATNWEGVDIHTKGSIPVECVTLDDFLEKQGINQVDILKIDVQGAEMAVLRGAEKALDAGRIKVIFFEIITCDTYKNQPAIQDYLKFLDSKNYGLVGIYDQANGPDGQLRQLDALFAHRSLFHN